MLLCVHARTSIFQVTKSKLKFVYVSLSVREFQGWNGGLVARKRVSRREITRYEPRPWSFVRFALFLLTIEWRQCFEIVSNESPRKHAIIKGWAGLINRRKLERWHRYRVTILKIQQISRWRKVACQKLWKVSWDNYGDSCVNRLSLGQVDQVFKRR